MVNAVLDALAPLGFDPLTMRLDMPLTPEKVWRVIQALEGAREQATVRAVTSVGFQAQVGFASAPGGSSR